MRSIKQRGLDRELRPLIRRVKRAYAMDRIGSDDFAYLTRLLDRAEARIIRMSELDELGEEVTDDG